MVPEMTLRHSHRLRLRGHIPRYRAFNWKLTEADIPVCPAQHKKDGLKPVPVGDVSALLYPLCAD